MGEIRQIPSPEKIEMMERIITPFLTLTHALRAVKISVVFRLFVERLSMAYTVEKDQQ